MGQGDDTKETRCVCVCVCVCERERERERVGVCVSASVSMFQCFHRDDVVMLLGLHGLAAVLPEATIYVHIWVMTLCGTTNLFLVKLANSHVPADTISCVGFTGLGQFGTNLSHFPHSKS